ncbi:MAG: UvrD-helicase domain-containing protein, partial [Candidatus Paceibacteria bacterium]
MYFTSEQENIIQANEGALLVTAGPGTGKTRTLTQKIIWLLREENRSPQHISLFTFSTKAVEELRTRLSQSVSELPWIATFHALAYRIVHHYTQSPPHIISSEYQSQMFNRLAKLYNVPVSEISLNLSQERSSLNSDSQISDIRDTYR